LKVTRLDLAGVLRLEPELHRDARGFLFESYRRDAYARAGIDVDFVQDNHTASLGGTLRGLHYQVAPGQAKLIRVVAGKIHDVVVDLRPGSPTFGRHLGVELDAEEHHQLFVPKGFAHGFCVVSERAEVLYRLSAVYDPAAERSLKWDDPDLGIPWPVREPILSPRDQQAESFRALRARLGG
jgi:dTDP-4-dehydrorhamnose 3,5-epimerase